VAVSLLDCGKILLFAIIFISVIVPPLILPN